LIYRTGTYKSRWLDPRYCFVVVFIVVDIIVAIVLAVVVIIGTSNGEQFLTQS
jgi:hypothetical protein